MFGTSFSEAGHGMSVFTVAVLTLKRMLRMGMMAANENIFSSDDSKLNITAKPI